MNILEHIYSNNSDKEQTCLSHLSSTYSYQKTFDCIVELSNKMSTLGVDKGSIVVLYLSRSDKSVLALLSCLYLGAAYLPINIKAPRQRIKEIIDNNHVSLIITDESIESELFEGNQILITADFCNEDLPNHSIFSPAVVTEDDLAYVLHTSGTTGQPKAVRISYRNMYAFLHATDKCCQIKQKDIVSHLADLTFDASVYEIFGALLKGATLSIASDAEKVKPTQFLIENFVSVSIMTPSLFKLLDEQYIINSIRMLIFGGEILYKSHISKARYIMPNAKILNSYGPTETTVMVTIAGDCDLDYMSESDIISIGYPLDGVEYIISGVENQDNKELSGELVILGDFVANEYNEKICDNSIIYTSLRESGCELFGYYTGDLVEVRDGLLYFLGRKDRQVKVNGKRFDLGGVELQIKKISGARSVFVDMNENRKLIAYIEKPSISESQIKDCLSEVLMYYMLPSGIIIMDEFPLTSGFKIDVKELRSLSSRQNLLEAVGQPFDEQIRSTVIEVIGISESDYDDKSSFLMNGGDSFKAQILVMEIFEKFKFDIELTDVLQADDFFSLLKVIKSLDS